MTVFKTFLKVLNKCKVPIILYTVMLVFFGAFNMQSNDFSFDFVASKPDVFIINEDETKGITNHLIRYIEEHSNIIKLNKSEDAIKDALFYRDVNYIITIPKGFRENILQQKMPKIEVQGTNDYQASLAEMILERYIKVLNVYQKTSHSEEELMNLMDQTLSLQADIKVTSSLDTAHLEKASRYFNFMNYCILAGCIYIICLILSSFKNETIKKRTMISSMNYKKYNRILLFSNGLFAFVLWAFYIILGFLLLGDVMFSVRGIYFMLNSFLFTFCSLTVAFLLGNLVQNKEAVNGIVNVVALGSSFLCGAFVPMEYLPNFVLSIAHILPSYWYIKTNELLKDIEVFSFDTLKPVLFAMAVLVLFSILFIILTNLISYKKRKID